MAVNELDTDRRNDRIILFDQKQENRVTDSNLVAVRKPMLLHRHSIDHRTVAAFEVLDLKSTVFGAEQQTMFARNGWVNHRQGVGRVSP
jgi:hypothetical protein